MDCLHPEHRYRLASVAARPRQTRPWHPDTSLLDPNPLDSLRPAGQEGEEYRSQPQRLFLQKVARHEFPAGSGQNLDLRTLLRPEEACQFLVIEMDPAT